MAQADAVLIVGEIIVDVTIPHEGELTKLRLGGVCHAARGLWAAGLEYAVAAFCPKYLQEQAKKYLTAIGCTECVWLGEVAGAPSLILIGDAREVGQQGYEDLMRDTKRINVIDPLPRLDAYHRVLVFPGKFEVGSLAGAFASDAQISFDIAYDLKQTSQLGVYKGRVAAIAISTSSPLFIELGRESIDDLLRAVEELSPEVLLLKENRGGSRLFNLRDEVVEKIPATLGTTVNSVGVGDVYSGVMVGLSHKGWVEAAWRGSQAASEYAQTTFPDDFRREVQRDFRLSVEETRALGGTILPWHDRRSYSIYLAGPDFSYVTKDELDNAVACLMYHNFKIRRPVLESGELKRPATDADVRRTYRSDYEMLKKCDLVFAIPLGRDPGTLVEIGMAIEMGKPVITYDPRRENDNTMVVAGSAVYSADLETCLTGTFIEMAVLRAASQ